MFDRNIYLQKLKVIKACSACAEIDSTATIDLNDKFD